MTLGVLERLTKRHAYYQNHKEHIQKKSRDWETAKRIRWKLMVIRGYGGKCACCGEDEINFLTLEHKEHDGKQHKLETGGWSKHYEDIIKQGFPKKYTVLCMNCNWATRLGDKCPHKIK